MNDGHVWSISLCSFYYVMILLLFWGHEPCIGFFLWRFKMPDALICYPGSIEKLKLLGATYLLTTYLQKLSEEIASQVCTFCEKRKKIAEVKSYIAFILYIL
jgi:hypothetical protein